jgi:hypothetical protein
MPADPNAVGAAAFGTAGFTKPVSYPDDTTVIAIGPQADCSIVMVQPANYAQPFPVSVDCPFVGLSATESNPLIHGKPRAADFIAKGPILVTPYVIASAIDGLNGAQSVDLLFYSQHPGPFAMKRAPVRKRADAIGAASASPLVWVHGRRLVRVIAQGTAGDTFDVQWYEADRLNVGLLRNVSEPFVIGPTGLAIIDFGLGQDDNAPNIGGDLVRALSGAHATSFTVEAFD